MRSLSDLLKPVVALPIILGLLAIAGWWAYFHERSELATARQSLAGARAQHQELQGAHEQLQAEAAKVQSTLADTEQAAGDLEAIRGELANATGTAIQRSLEALVAADQPEKAGQTDRAEVAGQAQAAR